MRLILFFVLILILPTTVQTQVADTIYLWKNKVPGETEPKSPPEVSPDNHNNVIRLAKVTDPVLLVFEPDSAVNNGIGIIICPGGAYSWLAVNIEGYEVAEWFAGLGYTSFVLQYRVPNKQEGALSDIQRAIRIIRGRADEWNLNPAKIGVIGFSAGGNLCARASTLFSKNNYPRVDSFDDLSCRPDFSIFIYPAKLADDENRYVSPELDLANDIPPMFIFGTADDNYSKGILTMAAALREKKHSVELHMLSEGGHGYGLRKGNVAAETWPALVEAWLERIIK